MEPPRYRTIREAVEDLDEIIIATISGFSMEKVEDGYMAVFKVAFFGPDLEAMAALPAGERAETVASYPDVVVLIDDAVWPADQIAALEETRILGEFHTIQVPPRVPGNDTDMPKWVVTTHGGSQAERIAWRKSIA